MKKRFVLLVRCIDTVNGTKKPVGLHLPGNLPGYHQMFYDDKGLNFVKTHSWANEATAERHKMKKNREYLEKFGEWAKQYWECEVIEVPETVLPEGSIV